MSEAYEKLIRWCKDRALLASCATVLEWDEETAMPEGGVEHRSRQLALLAGLEHQRWLDPALEDLLAVEPRDEAGKVNVRELRRLHKKHRRLDRSLVEETAQVRAIAQHQYSEALQLRQFSLLEPWLEKILALKREEAKLLSDGGELYDVLLDDFEPGIHAATLETLFKNLAPELKRMVDAIAGSPYEPRRDFLERAVPIEQQRALVKLTLARLGFDFDRGRLDEASHPSTVQLGPSDVRVATRYRPHDFGEGFFCALHELGHGLYDQGLPQEHHGTPYGEAPSLGAHESQARLWENLVGRSGGFWRFFESFFRKTYSGIFDDISLDELIRAFNHVAPTQRRVRADEVTYNLHILIRFELERAMIKGDLKVADLPGAWDEAYLHHLGFKPSGIATGLLQDGHWASGMFGYFPTYTLGNLTAAQLFIAAENELGSLDRAFAAGEFSQLLGWLRKKVHHRAGALRAPELIAEATGKPLGSEALISVLRGKIRAVYKV